MSQKYFVRIAIVTLLLILTIASFHPETFAAEESTDKEAESKSAISLPENMTDTMIREASQVGRQIQSHARSLFERSPMGWDMETLFYIYDLALSLPLKIPMFMKYLIDQSRTLGLAGSVIMIIFLTAVIYSLMGRSRVLKFIDREIQPLKEKIPAEIFPYFYSLLKVTVSSLIPLLLMGCYAFVNALIHYTEPWFLLCGKLLGVWAVTAFVLKILYEIFIENLFNISSVHSKKIYRVIRLIIFYIVLMLILFWVIEAFQAPDDILAFLKFVISLSIVSVSVLLFRKKKELLSLLPKLPYTSYIAFTKGLDRYYYMAICISFVSALLFCFGYTQFTKVLWTKTWAVALSYVAIVTVYHILSQLVERWADSIETMSTEADFLLRSVRTLLLYITVITAVTVILMLLGLFEPIQRVMSFPIINISDSSISMWVVVKACIIMAVFIFVSRMVRSYLDYKIYPSLKIETGLAYAMNTFLKFVFFAIGFMVSMRVVGIDLRVFMVFAGAIGIGVGFGLQTLAANMISGLTLVFGRKLRKGDWIEMNDTIGRVTEITFRTTKVQNRDNIEYIIPNNEFMTRTVVNYTLASPLIRMKIPVGVTYNADPEEVREALMKAASEHKDRIEHNKTEVFFAELGDNSINFNVLIWFDISKTGRNRMRSLIYFSVFKELNKRGIEIPYPQRDIHIRSGLVGNTA